MGSVSQIGPEGATALQVGDRAASIRPTLPTPLEGAWLGPALTDALLAVAWSVLALDGLRQSRRERAARSALGPVVAGDVRPPAAVRLLVLAVVIAGGATLEHLVGRFHHRPLAAAAGLALVGVGLVLHGVARRALGPHWSPVVTVRAGQPVVERGPYAVVRHPLYAALLLVASGSLLAHPSPAMACVAGGLTVGLLWKVAREERVLREALGADYARYAARVPALVPRLRLSGRRR
jgi:protein-S-isoprenylcysteine O-methyltransferase Ste14